MLQTASRSIVLTLLFITPAIAQDEFADVEIKATHLRGPVHMLEGRGGNIGVTAGPDGIIIIDDQFAPLADKIRAALKGIEPGELKFVLNTHWHGDHTGGNPVFGPEATIISHTNVRKRLSTEQELFGRIIKPLPPEGLPVITYDDGVSIHFNGEEIIARHYPHGHTDGDSVIFFTKSNVVHMGDHFFNGMFPFVDLDHGGSVQGMAANVKKILDGLAEDVKIIPGHGPLAEKDDLKTFHRMLTESMQSVKKAMDAGKTLADIQEDGLGDEWADWGTGFIKTDQWIATVHASLSAE